MIPAISLTPAIIMPGKAPVPLTITEHGFSQPVRYTVQWDLIVRGHWQPVEHVGYRVVPSTFQLGPQHPTAMVTLQAPSPRFAAVELRFVPTPRPGQASLATQLAIAAPVLAPTGADPAQGTCTWAKAPPWIVWGFGNPPPLMVRLTAARRGWWLPTVRLAVNGHPQSVRAFNAPILPGQSYTLRVTLPAVLPPGWDAVTMQAGAHTITRHVLSVPGPAVVTFAGLYTVLDLLRRLVTRRRKISHQSQTTPIRRRRHHV